MNIYDELELAYGNHFEDLFSKLMKQKYGFRYQIISTCGNIGDMKVDGVLDCNIAFAVYAPEVYREQNVIQKLRTDFNGFMEHKRNGEWSSINQYCFVVKRERQGITPLVANQIFTFNKDFPVAVMTMEDLKKIADGYLTFSADGYLLEEFMVDVTEIGDVKKGDEVTLIGRDGDEFIGIEEIGDLCGRFSYEFACDISPRVPRVYIKNGKEI